MAFGARQINPLDKKPRVAVGINIPFSATNAITPNFTTRDALKNNVINFLLTNTNERYMKPTFGGNLISKLYGALNETEAETIGDEIRQLLRSNFPNITIKELNFQLNETTNSITFNIVYDTVTNEGEIINITI
jgi:phage baseplate assembly protein W